MGKALLRAAIEHADKSGPITVTTFDRTEKAVTPAGNLYHAVGFREFAAAGPNPAGISAVTMLLIKAPACLDGSHAASGNKTQPQA